MTRRDKKIDLVFVLDGTMKGVFDNLKYEIVDTVTDFHMKNRRADDRYAVVVYRDPVDRRDDKHEFLQLTSSSEELEMWLDNIKSWGGGDDPEDWAGALKIVLDQVAWRDGKKSVFWISDADAHGPRFSGLGAADRHPDQEAVLVDLVRRMVRENIYFQAINIKKGSDKGCERTLTEIKAIYQEMRGKPVMWDDFECPREADEAHAKGSADFFGPVLTDEQLERMIAEGKFGESEDVSMEGDKWSQEVLDKFQETINGTMNRSAARLLVADEDAHD